MTVENQNFTNQELSIVQKKALKRDYDKAWREKNKQKKKDTDQAYRKNNKEKIKVKTKEYNKTNRDKQLEYNRNYYQERKEERLTVSRKWRQNNPHHHKQWRSNNNYFKKRYKQHKEKLEEDHLYAAKYKLRLAVHDTFKRIGKNKSTTTLELLGCSWEEAKVHIESLWQEGMTWENHGRYGWHIDHIRPVSSFEDHELDEMNHISNLQPLWAEDNLSKSDSLFFNI